MKADEALLPAPMSSTNHKSEVSHSGQARDSGQSASQQAFDAITMGAFSAPSSAERVLRLQQWLAQSPPPEQVQLIYRELSHKDKGAARLLRERLDEIRHSKSQADKAQEWAQKAQALLDQPRMNLADALAWQRDAAKAGAPLSKEPLLDLKAQLAERVRATEELQHKVQVQREAAVLLAQRIEVLSTKSWAQAESSLTGLQVDVQGWQQDATSLAGDSWWGGMDHRFSAMLDDARAQLLQVWDAFLAAVAQAQAASQDVNEALPQVPVWAEELRAARMAAQAPAVQQAVDPEEKARAQTAVSDALTKLESEVSLGHGKASAGAANALRAALQANGHLIDARLDKRAQRVLAAERELESWQRWRADQLREELISQAMELTRTASGQTMGGRKLQEKLRTLREQWKGTDQGGVPNHGLWKKFDSACNQAHKLVEAWLSQRKEEAAAAAAQRQSLIDELRQWAALNRSALDEDWRGFSRVLQEFSERWRAGGHLDKKQFAQWHEQWKQALDEAAAPLKSLQQASVARRQGLIDEARALGEQANFQIQAVKALQQRWQAEAHVVPLDRRLEQKLWDAFRKPIDQAFERRQTERAKVDEAAGAHDKTVLAASKALQQANASGDAQQIKRAMDALQDALRGATGNDLSAKTGEQLSEARADLPQEPVPTEGHDQPQAPESAAPERSDGRTGKRLLVAMRGDDRPGNRVSASPAGHSDKARELRGRRDRANESRERGASRPVRAQAPRLGDAAFRAQRDALEHAQSALRRLAAHAHGEALAHLLDAWQRRDAGAMPSVQELGSGVNASARASWVRAIDGEAHSGDAQAMLRLEMAAEVPSPADFLSERRMLQLQLLTRRNEPLPAQTWLQDVGRVLAQQSDPVSARRLQNVLKVLLKP